MKPEVEGKTPSKIQINDADSDSLDEETSHQKAEAVEDKKKTPSIKHIHANVSINGDTVKLSDNELSIVESAGG